eukprot:4418819-Pyramimonas_sp.AAC.1
MTALHDGTISISSPRTGVSRAVVVSTGVYTAMREVASITLHQKFHAADNVVDGGRTENLSAHEVRARVYQGIHVGALALNLPGVEAA